MIRKFANGDIATSGEQFLEGSKRTGQAVYNKLRLFLGEYFLDIRRGTPWFQSILGKVPQDVAEIAIKQQIITTPGVAAISSFEFTSDRNQRRLNITATVIDNAGNESDVVLDEELI